MSENNKNNNGPREESLSIAAGAVEDDASPQTDVVVGDEPTEKPKRLWLWITLVGLVAVVAVAIAVPVSIHLVNRTAKLNPTIWPRTPEGLAGLIQSRLSSISFDNTTSPESRALVWMTEVDTVNQQDLSDDQLVQRFAMAAIGYSINGLSNWFTDSTECSWGSGLVGCNPLGEVSSIDDQSYSLSGSIPVSMGLLTKIEVLYLLSNALTGTIPSEIGRLTALRSLWLNNNALTGRIPSEIGGLTALGVLSLASNDLVGTIPSELGGLTSLGSLYLSSNTLTGRIPSEVGGLTALLNLQFQENRLTGTMPTGVCGRASPSIDCGEIICDCCLDASFQQCP